MFCFELTARLENLEKCVLFKKSRFRVIRTLYLLFFSKNVFSSFQIDNIGNFLSVAIFCIRETCDLSH